MCREMPGMQIGIQIIKEGEQMGRIEHITTQQIIGEWGSIEKFAASHGVSSAST